MSISDRDKKIIMILVPILAVLGFWFLVLGPKRSEATKLGSELEQAQSKRDDTVAQASTLQGARDNYAKDYAAVVRLGKAIPSTVDMPSLLVQLDTAAKGTKIDFDEVKAGERTAAATPAASTSSSTTSSSSSSSSSSGSTPSEGSSSGASSAPVASGGASAQSGPGKSAESANNAQQTSNGTSAAQGADAGSTGSSSASSSSSSSTTGTTGTTGSTGTTTGSGAAGLDSVPLTFAFSGSFFDLADFFHRLKRFVRAANGNVDVKGRLMTIDGLNFKSDSFPSISATVDATVYLSPKTEGTTAGATAQGPQATPASSTTTSAPPATSQTTSNSGQGNPQ